MTSHYLNQWWFVYQRINASLGFNELRVPFTNTISNHRDPHTPEKFQVSTFPHSWNVQHFHVCFDSNHLNCHNYNSPEKFNTFRLRQNGRHFPDNIFKCIFFSENVWISLKISLRFVPNGPINNIPALVQIMAYRLVIWTNGGWFVVTRPQWVKTSLRLLCHFTHDKAWPPIHALTDTRVHIRNFRNGTPRTQQLLENGSSVWKFGIKKWQFLY